MKKQIKHVGFTLIELLVVIAVIMVLSAMLFPVVGRMQERGRSAKCVSNLRQLHTASQSYVNSSGGTLPHAASAKKWEKDDAGVFQDAGWITGWVASHLAGTVNMKSYWWGSNSVYCITNGTLFTYLGETGDEAVYLCPTMQKAANDTIRSYGMNSQLSGATYADIDGLSRRILFADQGFENMGKAGYLNLRDSDAWSDPVPVAATNSSPYYQRFFRSIDGSIDSSREFIGELHGTQPGLNNGMANVIFCDGHVESVAYTQTTNVCSGNWEAGAPVQ